jgi:hypothetical protein
VKIAIAVIFAMFAGAVFLILRPKKQPKERLRGNGGSEAEASRYYTAGDSGDGS